MDEHEEELNKAREIAEWMKSFCTLFVDQNGVEYISIEHPKYPEHNGLYQLDADMKMRKLERIGD